MKRSKSNNQRMGLFFDPKRPAMPGTVMGYDSGEILKVADAAGMALLYTPYKYKQGIIKTGISGYEVVYSAADALRIAPLLGRVAAGEQLVPEDVRPYRKAIKGIARRHNFGFGFADRMCVATSILGVGILARKALNRRVERQFIDRAPALIQKMRDNVHILEPYVERIEAVSNPRAEVQSEIGLYASLLKIGARHSAYSRGSYTVNSMDVASGVEGLANTIYNPPADLAEYAPLTHELLSNVQLGPRPCIAQGVVAVAAPEIVSGLDRCLPLSHRDPEFLRQVVNQPAPRRNLALHMRGNLMSTLDRVANHVIPNAVHCLPTSGSSVRVAYSRLQQFLGVAS